MLLLTGFAGIGHSTPSLDELPCAIIRVAGVPHPVRLADSSEARARGFQHVPEAAMHTQAIYFLYPQPVRPSFHMRNVAAPLRIAWIAPDRKVLEVTEMQPGDSGYRPPAAILAALEFTPEHSLAGLVRAGRTIDLVGSGGNGVGTECDVPDGEAAPGER